MSKLVARFVKDESGATAIEYGLIAGALGTAINAKFVYIEGKVTAAK